MNAGERTSTKLICLLGHSALDRLAYKRLLRDELNFETTAEADFAPTSVWTAMRTKPHLVLVVADIPTSEILDAVQMLARLQPQTGILIVSAAVEPIQIEAWGRCPLHGYVVKDGGVEELRTALHAILEGRSYYSPGTRAALDRGAGRANGTVRLSRRESDLLPLLARGLTLREAAAQMSVSYKTADAYRSNLLRKLGMHDRVELVRYAIRKHIIEP